MWFKYAFIALGVFALRVDAVYKVCATARYSTECTQLQRGNSEVLCQYVQDSIECANRIRNGTADFGTFSAESTAQLARLGWDGLSIIKELRHISKQEAILDFEVVVLVRNNHTAGIVGAAGKGYCHPGFHYSRTHRWTEHFYKYFERRAIPPVCNNTISMAEVETIAASNFFSKACRPGIWSHDRIEDAQLKKKYPNLCELCDNKSYCSYLNDDISQVFECLMQGDNVAVVSYQDVKDNDKTGNISSQFSYLCPDGKLQAIRNNSYPCSWVKEPWGVIMTSSPRSIDMGKLLDSWRMKAMGSTWQSTLFTIILPSSYQMVPTTIQSPADYMTAYNREFNEPNICNRTLTWCTTSLDERAKCQVAQAGAFTSGVRPIIECSEPGADTVDCINAISQFRADFMGIDSNFGYLARSLYNLTAAMYFETEMDQYSSVVAVVHDGSNYKTFESLRGARACIPEFGGTASIAFVNALKGRGTMNRRECRYGMLMSSFFGDSCAPGAKDFRYQRTTDIPLSLCSLCKAPNQTDELRARSYSITGNPSSVSDACSANDDNPYYGNDGALKCLSEGADVAIVELQSLQDHALNLNISENEYRIICRNGSLASTTGFAVDLDCALTTIVDGEIVVRRGSEKTTTVINALSAMDSYFQTNPDFKMYNIYDSEKHLLFKDSTIGLIGYNEVDLPPRVKNYKQLFEYVESCKQGNSASSVNISSFMGMLMLVVVSAYLAL